VLNGVPPDPADSKGNGGDRTHKKREKGERYAVTKHLFKYRDAKGTLVAVHRRDDYYDAEGKHHKDMWWEGPDGQLGLSGVRVEDLPLYGLCDLETWSHGSRVYLVEGELKCDHLSRAIYGNGKIGSALEGAAVATGTGASGTPCDATLAALLEFDVVLWPDNDATGREHMQRIGAWLKARGKHPRWVDWPDAPAKGDVADFLAAGHTVAEIERMIGDVSGDGSEQEQSEYQEDRPDPSINSLNSYFVAPDRPIPPMRPAAFIGLAGEFVSLMVPHTESDPVALLLQFLVYVGAAVGSGPHFTHEATRHRLNEYVVLVGRSGHGRKGTSHDRVHNTFARVADNFTGEHVVSGLSSGEGLVSLLRDREDGSTDKRVLVFEPEFAGPLQQMAREGNVLSVVLRDAWDRPNLRTLTKHDPMIATGTHVSMIGHITSDDLLRYMTPTLAGNGLGNRILWAAVNRADHRLPFGGDLNPKGLDDVEKQMKAALQMARAIGSMGLDDEAKHLWQRAYPVLSSDRPGLLGKLTGRAEAHTRRVACIYAVLDGAPLVSREHLRAALAVWAFCEDSVAQVFGEALGDGTADTILAALQLAGTDGLTLTELHAELGRNARATEVRRALAVLSEHKLARCQEEAVPGTTKKAQRWFAVRASDDRSRRTKYEFNEFTDTSEGGEAPDAA
jgi:hypothetical protein